MRKSDSGLVPTFLYLLLLNLLVLFEMAGTLRAHPAQALGVGLESPRFDRCSRRGRLALELDRTVPASFSTPPLALVVLDATSFLALDHTRGISPFGLGDSGVPSPGSLVFAGLGRFDEGALAFTDRAIFRYSTSRRSWSPIDMRVALTDIRSAQGGPGEQGLWIIDGTEGEATVHRLRPVVPSGQIYSVDSSWHLPGNWRLTSMGDGEGFAISTRFPFHMMRFFDDGRAVELGSLGAFEEAFAVPDTMPVYASTVASMDCKAVLITLADLRSSRRWLFAVDSRDGSLLTNGHVDATIGFFDALPDRREIFAYRDTASGGEVLVYRWSWVPDQSLSTKER